MPLVCTAADLKIGDVVQVAFSGPYLSATVSKITDDAVHVVRPFITFHNSIATDASMSPLLGTEDMYYAKTDTVMLWERVSGPMPSTGRKFDLSFK